MSNEVEQALAAMGDAGMPAELVERYQMLVAEMMGLRDAAARAAKRRDLHTLKVLDAEGERLQTKILNVAHEILKHQGKRKVALWRHLIGLKPEPAAKR